VIPAWFEGGQTPLHVRTPKLHGFKNRFRVEYAPVNLSKLSGAETGTLITPEVLVHDGLLRDTALPLKILGNGDAPAGVTIHAHAFSRSALDKLTAAGSTAQRISWPEGNPLDELAEAPETHGTADKEARPSRAAVEPGAGESEAELEPDPEDGADAPGEAGTESESES
jgi:ribosomal protein L15